MKKQFKGALVKYQQLFSTVTIPIIIHQVTASIARCHAHLKQWDEALEYAKRSVSFSSEYVLSSKISLF